MSSYLLVSQRTTNDYGLIPDMLRESKDRQCTGLYMKPNLAGGLSYCALGTIYHRMGMSPLSIFLNDQNKRDEVWKKLGVENRKQWKICPKCARACSMGGLLVHLNDDHKMKWGEIADNLEIAKDYDRSQYGFIRHWRNVYFGIK